MQSLPWNEISIAGYVFGAVVAAAALMYGVRAGGLPLGSDKANLKLLAYELLGVAVLVGAAVQFVCTLDAPRFSAVGTVTNLYQTHGRGAHSSFCLVEGEVLNSCFTTHFSGSELRDDERLAITYIGYSGQVVNFQVVASDGSLGYLYNDTAYFIPAMCMLLGLYYLGMGYWRHAKYPDGSAPARRTGFGLRG
jgi:hypothetical protein